MGNLSGNLFYAYELKLIKKYWNCCAGPSNGLITQIELQPNRWQYPLIDYLSISTDENLAYLNEISGCDKFSWPLNFVP